MSGQKPSQGVREPSLSELAERQARMEREQRDQWEQIHATRDRVAAAEQGMERLWTELHAFRRESREDAHQVTQAISDLGQKLSTKADTYSDNWRRKVDEALSQRRGGLNLAAWLLGLGIPAIAAMVAAAYYITQMIGGG